MGIYPHYCPWNTCERSEGHKGFILKSQLQSHIETSHPAPKAHEFSVTYLEEERDSGHESQTSDEWEFFCLGMAGYHID